LKFEGKRSQVTQNMMDQPVCGRQEEERNELAGKEKR
jgi:hypothetical protein